MHGCVEGCGLGGTSSFVVSIVRLMLVVPPALRRHVVCGGGWYGSYLKPNESRRDGAWGIEVVFALQDVASYWKRCRKWKCGIDELGATLTHG